MGSFGKKRFSSKTFPIPPPSAARAPPHLGVAPLMQSRQFLAAFRTVSAPHQHHLGKDAVFERVHFRNRAAGWRIEPGEFPGVLSVRRNLFQGHRFVHGSNHFPAICFGRAPRRPALHTIHPVFARARGTGGGHLLFVTPDRTRTNHVTGARRRLVRKLFDGFHDCSRSLAR